jgi:hypothetical protein
MWKDIKEASGWIAVALVITFVAVHSVYKDLTSPLTSAQLQEIKTKVTAYNLTFVSTLDKEWLGCGSGHTYRVPIKVTNTSGAVLIINYCSGSLFTPSQIKI